MNRKQDNSHRPDVLLATRVSPEVREAFQRVADGEDRSVSAALRRMVEKRIAEEKAPA